MSRKKSEQSNTPHIGIFADKSAKYNLGILKALYKLTAATTWQIAKKLCNAPEMSKEVLDYRARSIYSIIQRKGGRLEDLENKGYIQQEEGLWSLTVKGNIALGIKEPELLEKALESEPRNFVFEQFKQNINTISDEQIKQPFGISVNLSETKRDLNKLMDRMNSNPMITKLALVEIKSLLHEGIDLDRISEDTLESLLYNRPHFKEALKDLLKNL